MLIVAVLTVRRSHADEFHRFEAAAARIMARHGGAIERTVVLDPIAPAHPAAPAATEPDTFRELHLVRFRDAAAFHAYRADPELAALAPLRAAAIAATDIWTGTDGPSYG